MHYQIISTDNHVNEPPGTYVDRLPRHLKEDSPRIVPGSDGGEGWSFDGKAPKTTFGLEATGATAGQNYEAHKKSGFTWGDVPPGSYDGAVHIKENETDGVDAAAIYPGATIGAYEVPDRELAVGCVRAYNDWLIDDFCSADPQRLLSLAFIPVNDGVPIAVAEAERVIAKGARGLFLPLPEVPYHDPQYDPLWNAAVDAHLPITIHRTGVSSNPMIAGTLPPRLVDGAPGINIGIIVQRYFSAVGPISNLILTGLFERFPSLVFIAAEVNCYWVPGLVQQLDREYERDRVWDQLPISSKPSSYFGKNIFVTILDDFFGCKIAKDDSLLASTAMYSTDYPHATTLWPQSKEFIAKMTNGMAEDKKAQILAGNAIRAYSLNG